MSYIRLSQAGIGHRVKERPSNPETNKIFKKNQSSCLQIASINTRTLSNEAYLIQFENAITKIKYDVIGLSEVKRIGEELISRNDYFFYYNGITRRRGSVGFIIKNIWKNKFKIQSYSDRIISLTLEINTIDKFSIIQCYAPTSQCSNDEISEFYFLLNEACENLKNDTWLTIIGDFNSKIGIPLSTDNDVMGKFGYGERNERGELLINFARENDFFFTNTMFKCRQKRRSTWECKLANNRIVQNEIDFILVRKIQIKMVKNFKVLSKFEFESDHKLIRMCFKLKNLEKKIFRYEKIVPRIKFDNDLTKIKTFKEKLDNTQNHLNGKYENLIKIIDDASVPFKSKRVRVDKLTSETRKKIIERENLRTIKTHSVENYEKYIKTRKIANRMIRNDVYRFEIDRLMNLISNNNPWKFAKDGISTGRKLIIKMKDDKGVNHFKTDEIIEIASKYYENLYSSNLKEDENLKISPNLHDHCEYEIFYFDELKNEISRMKNRKSTGTDGIPIDLLKSCDDEFLGKILEIFNNILESEIIPEEWMNTHTILIHKKGKICDLNNYRPITLVNHLYKLFMRLLLKKNERKLDENLSHNQAGFRKNYSTTDHMFVIQQLIEKHNEMNIDLVLGFVDFSKAFDSIEHPFLWKSLYDQNIPVKYIRIIKKIYNNSETQIKINNQLGRKLKIKRGIKQGDPLSPKCFTATLEEIVKNLNHTKGLKISNHYLNQLSFADDIVLISDNMKNMSEMMNELYEKAKIYGLEINFEKTKIMTNIKTNQNKIKVAYCEVECVKSFKYLGREFSFEDSTEIEIKNRITNAWKSFGALKKYLLGKLPMFFKKKLFDSCVLPCFTYGCQTWSLTQRQKELFETAQHSMERKITNIKLKDKISIKKLRKKTKLIDVRKKISELKWNWAGHFQRHQNKLRWPKIIEKWEPSGIRNRGKQKTRWCDEIRNHGGGIFWRNKSQNKKIWKELGETFVQL